MAGKRALAGAAADLVGRPIEAIVPLPSNPNRRRVRVGGRTAATLWAGEIEALGIEVGRRWTSHLQAALTDVLARRAARDAAMRLLGRRALSRQALRDRLLAKGHEPNVIEPVVAQLATDGWLNDQALGEAVAHGIIARGPAGRKLIEQRLAARGIPDAPARQIAQHATEHEDAVDAAITLARKRLASLGDVNQATAVRRLAGALARRGFDEDTVEAAMARLGLGRDDS